MNSSDQLSSSSGSGGPGQVAQEGLTLEQLAASLGPFSPPRDFDHGEEFLPASPRPIPSYLRQGSHARRNRGTLYCLIALGIMCLVFRPLPFVEALSNYILPLWFLHWIGAGLIALGVLKFLWNLVSAGRFEYVRNGRPFVGRVLGISTVTEGTAEMPLFRYVAAVEFVHPDTGQHAYYFLPAEEGFPINEAANYSCDVLPGEYVTLLDLPGKPDSKMKVYGFLGLDPELEFILKNGQPLQGMSPFTAIMITLVVSLIVLMVMGAFDLLMFSWPLSGGWKLPLLLAIGGGLVGGLAGVMLRALGKQPERGSGLTFLGSGLLGAIGAPLLMLVLNSQLDRSPSTFQPVEIVKFWETTHNGVVRTYELEYRELPAGAIEKRHIRFSQIEGLRGADYAVLAVCQGRFGYPWARAVHPVVWVPFEGAIEEHLQAGRPLYSFTYRDPEDPQAEPVAALAIPAVAVDDESLAPCPEALVEPAASRFRTSYPDLRMITLGDIQK